MPLKKTGGYEDRKTAGVASNGGCDKKQEGAGRKTKKKYRGYATETKNRGRIGRRKKGVSLKQKWGGGSATKKTPKKGRIERQKNTGGYATETKKK